jgi:hypothetical protein
MGILSRRRRRCQEWLGGGEGEAFTDKSRPSIAGCTGHYITVRLWVYFLMMSESESE